MTTRNDCVDAAVNELEALGISYTIEDRGKHQMLHWNVQGDNPAGKRQFALPSTPSDWRAAKNSRAEVRRMLRADGLLKEKSINEIDQKEANRHLFKKVKRLEAELALAWETSDKQVKKLREDFEAMVALMSTPAPAPVPVAVQPSAPSAPVIVAAPPAPPATPVHTPTPDYAALEAECLANPRLPPRPGFRVIPERYVRINKTAKNPDRDPTKLAPTYNPREYKYVRTTTPKKRGPKSGSVRADKNGLLPDALARVKERLAKRRLNGQPSFRSNGVLQTDAE